MDLNPLVLWEQMTILNKIVIIALILMSVWSLYVCVERTIAFRKARKQSLLFARQATEHLKNDRPQAAIDAASKYPQSHLARVVSAGLQSFQYENQTSPLSEVEIVEAIIDTGGNVTNVRVLKGLPMGLDRAAVEAVQRWKFKPAMLEGRPVKVYYVLTVNFQVQ